ncbi:nuclear transport factor 2 family protein [Flavihumibacter rivuli]|uniref:nuclear transport factor 2 family protein n=1 Tax=Flavihumibacter rivuli TaxID=2838156 RepID=UPI001BDE9CBA|nr:nuclear transport factor 2 family protein [Flavihumibacter rivuli]ULQ55230.1 nuclear transport factor 2 family protein [Flavihumibacter rivuli]
MADTQLNAYNARDIEGFLKPYSDSVKVYMFPDKLMYKGKDIMRKEYDDMFKSTPDLHCTLVNRITIGNKVIDRESVFFKKGVPPLDAVAIYTIEGGSITEVVFMQ